MQVAVIATDPGITVFLDAAGFSTIQLNPSEVPSLTGLLFDNPEIYALVIQDGETAYWSASHVLSAAKHLERHGPTILLGNGKLTRQCGNSKLICTIEKKDQLPPALRRRPKAADGGRGLSATDRLISTQIPTEEQPQPIRIRPLKIPVGKILMLGVVGSQHRIGCTTQSIGLWHYCKALGFDPAVVSTSEQISQIAGVMNCKEIEGGYQIEGVPFVADTALAYDCYILDIGTGSISEALKMTDYIVLVAGSKPWELQYTAAALRAAHGVGMGILLSFTGQKDAHSLQPLFGKNTAVAAPWVAELWQSDPKTLLVYDLLLRPALERILAQDEPQEMPPLFSELELAKEGN